MSYPTELCNDIISRKFNHKFNMNTVLVLAERFQVEPKELLRQSLDIKPGKIPNRNNLDGYFREELILCCERPILTNILFWLDLVKYFVDVLSGKKTISLYIGFVKFFMELEKNTNLIAENQASFAPWVELQIQESRECLEEIWQHANSHELFQRIVNELCSESPIGKDQKNREMLLSLSKLVTRQAYNSRISVVVDANPIEATSGLLNTTQDYDDLRNLTRATNRRFRNTKRS